MNKLRVIDLDTMDYDAALTIMHKVRDEVEQGEDDTLILVEHNPVITIGLDGGRHNIIDTAYIKEHDIPVKHIDRGGGAVVHNNGQLVGYPVMKVASMPVDLMTGIVDTMSDIVSAFKVKPKKGKEPGLWVSDGKIGFVGMKIHNRVSLHGFAINVSNDLALFDIIETCGVRSQKVTNLTLTTKSMVSMERVKHVAISRFARKFRYLPDKIILKEGRA